MAGRELPAILVTGGAGYIGSHTVLALRDAGREVAVVDDLSNGDVAALPESVAFHRGDVADVELLRWIIRRHGVGLVMHFAGSVSPPESVERPLDYMRNNTAASETLAITCAEGGVRRFIFSSSAAVYGRASPTPLREDQIPAPLTPYGASKLATEALLAELSRSRSGFEAVSLRYFNVAGADPAGRAGRRSRAGAGLVDRAVDVALGGCAWLDVWGDDYDTRDGAGERDYVHVSDVAESHLAAMRYLEDGGRSVILNCASGRGHTVLEVLSALETIVGRPVPRRPGPRRVGDVPSAVGDISRLSRTLGWRPRLGDLGAILRTTLAWRGWSGA